MKKNGYSNIELIITLAVFTVVYFVGVSKIAGDFDFDYQKELYDNTIKSIEDQATLYGTYTEGLFNEENTIYVTVLDLANENIIKSNSEGIVLDPRDNTKTLNDLKIKITKDNDNVTAKVLV